MAALHQLHHRPEIANIRHAYDSDRSLDYDSERSYYLARPSHSGSDKSYQTQPSIYSSKSPPRPPRVHHNTYDNKHGSGAKEEASRYLEDRLPQESPRASVATYASTSHSEENVCDEPPAYSVPQYRAQPYKPSAIAATPSDFSELFPSHRRLAVRHDDSTLDGNMNLRVDTEVKMHGGRTCDMTLFHLRMHDLRDREFSLRRYCRDSGREVCHTGRRPQKASSTRPGFQRSLSYALTSMLPKSEQRSPALSSLKRNDSGYGSAPSSLDVDRDDRPSSAGATIKPQIPVDQNSIKLEFSNYAQVDVKRTGVKSHKRYEFEYWGPTYAWKRVVQKDSQSKVISYHLTKASSDKVLAYIVPSPLTSAQAEEEHSKGGWIPPCSMWIDDDDLVRGQKDIADVIIASGLIALVDDCIRSRFHSKHAQQLVIPKLGVEYIGPKRLINEMFKRDGSSQRSRQSSSSRPSSSGQSTSRSRNAGSAPRRPSDGC